MGPSVEDSELERMCRSTVEGGGPRTAAKAIPALPARYVLLETVGEGGMGVVYTVYDRVLDRKVALKILHETRPAARARFLREAQALARLNHPAIVQIFDVGEAGDRPFLTMELVEGQSLRAWLGARPRGWLEIVRAFLAAGRGLAAAHEAGLVHRDVKPANILVGGDGSVRVADFGLARVLGAPTPADEAGTISGTPRYMAPEQADGAGADPRADQYSFCVSLREALAGRRSPVHVARALDRGLAGEREERFPSMNALLAALDPEPRRRHRRAAVALATLVVAVGGVLALRPAGDPTARCRDAATAKLAGAWDARRRGEVRAALLGTSRPYAPDVVATVERTLDGYRDRWRNMHTEVCRGEDAVALSALRMACLGRRRDELAATTELLARAPDLELLDRAPSVVGQVPPVSSCANTRALAAAVPPPERPDVVARVAALRLRLDTARALYTAGRMTKAMPIVAAAAVEASQLDYAPVMAEAFLLLAIVQDSSGAYGPAVTTLRQAAVFAARANDDLRLARAWTNLYRITAVRQGRLAEATMLLPAAEAALARAGDPPLERANLLANQALVELDAKQLAAGTAHLVTSFALRATFNPDDVHADASFGNLAYVAQLDGRYDDARRMLERELAHTDRLVGKRHPVRIKILSNLGVLARLQGRHQEALELREQALALAEMILGPDHLDVASLRRNLGNTLVDLGRLREAVALHRRALATHLGALGPDHPQVAATRQGLGRGLAMLGETEAARREIEESIRIFVLRKDAREEAVTNTVLGNSLAHADPAGSLRAFERSLAIFEKLLRPDHPDLAAAQLDVAEALLDGAQLDRAATLILHARATIDGQAGAKALQARAALCDGRLAAARGRGAEARRHLERALALREELEQNPTAVGEARFALAKVLWSTPAERPRARELASGALALYEQRSEGAQRWIDDIRHWLAAHPLQKG